MLRGESPAAGAILVAFRFDGRINRERCAISGDEYKVGTVLAWPITNGCDSAKNADASGGCNANPMRVRDADPWPGGIGSLARMLTLSQSNFSGLPPARYGPDGSLVNCRITSPPD